MFKPPRMSGTVGGKGAKYVNRVTQFFFNELGKGGRSPFVVGVCGCAVACMSYYSFYNVFVPAQERGRKRTAASNVPFTDSHNAFWGLPQGRTDMQKASTPAITPAAEAELHRPTLIHTEQSQTAAGSDIAVMELCEFDEAVNDDVYYRSIHYVTRSAATAGGVGATKSLEEAVEAERVVIPHIHDVVKCRMIDEANNCRPVAGHVESEYQRKTLVGLGPAHVLRDVAKIQFAHRFTLVNEPTVNVLVCGLRGGTMARVIAAAFPTHHIDVLERDPALVRVARRYLGVSDYSGLTILIGEAMDYFRRCAACEIDKRYDWIILDCLDGNGRLPSHFARFEFIENVRKSLANQGLISINIPNTDEKFLKTFVENWRMAFQQRTVLLFHCATTANTILMTFQDNAERGRLNIGRVVSLNDFRDLVKTQLRHYGAQRIRFDLLGELNEDNFRIFLPDTEYDLAHYLPKGHPCLRSQKAEAKPVWWKSALRGWLSPKHERMLSDMEARGEA